LKQFIAKFEPQIQGTLSGFDRVVFRGSLRRLTHSQGMKMYVKEVSQELKDIRDPKAGKDQIARTYTAKLGIPEGNVCGKIGDIRRKNPLELPERGTVGKTRVGGVDLNRSRMRPARRAMVALSTSRALGGLAEAAYATRQAAYDIKKLRAKQWLRRRANSHRCETVPVCLRAMAALIVLRDDVTRPLLAARCRLRSGRRPTQTAPIDAHYATFRYGMRNLIEEMGIAA
jgi:hypothetical protein